jgi:hypothetical protein
MTVTAVERQAKGAFFVIQINRSDRDVFTALPPATVIGEGRRRRFDRPSESRRGSHFAVRAAGSWRARVEVVDRNKASR